MDTKLFEPNRSHIIKDFKKFVSPGKVKTYRKYGMTFVPGERQGATIHDINHNAYLNFHCNGGVYNLGHRNPEIIAAARYALEHFDIGNHHLISGPKALLAKKIIETLPKGMTNVVFGVSGGEAADLAIKLAFAATKRKKIVSMKGGYHGHTGLALATGDARFKAPFMLDSDNFLQIDFDDMDAARRAVDKNTAAVIVETIPATLGMPIPAQDYFSQLKQLCEQMGALLIVDEVQTGLGRTGKVWAIEHYGVTPDLLISGKGLSGGIYPMTATCMTAQVYKILKENPFIHISTFGGSDIGCVCSLEVMNITSSPEFLESVNEKAAYFRELLEGLQDKHPHRFKEVRQLGLFVGLMFDSPEYTTVLCKALFENGVYAIYAANDKRVLQFMPPLVISKEDLKLGVERLEKSMDDLEHKLKFKSLQFLLKMMSDEAV